MSAERFGEPPWRWLGGAWVRSAPSIRIAAIFVLLGPSIFTIIFIALLLILSLVTFAGWEALLDVLVVGVFGLPIACLVGAAPALGTGVVVALRQVRHRFAGVGTAAAAGAVLTIAMAVVVRGRGLHWAGWEMLLSLVACGVGASIVCWRIALGRRAQR